LSNLSVDSTCVLPSGLKGGTSEGISKLPSVVVEFESESNFFLFLTQYFW